MSTTKIRVRLFAGARAVVGKEFVDLSVEQPADVQRLRASLVALCPELANWNGCRFAVNRQFAEEHELLQESDEVAFIPPVSGG